MPHVAELLVNLSGECGETVQAISKILQHGPLSSAPGGHNCNLTVLEHELGQILGVCEMLVASGFLSQAGVDAGLRTKLEKYPHWSHGELAVRNADPVDDAHTDGPASEEHF